MAADLSFNRLLINTSFPALILALRSQRSRAKSQVYSGRVQLLGPDQPCLWCSELLSPEEVRRDMMNEFERKADPYIQGANIPAPSVVSINGTVVSLAVTMLLGFVTSIPVKSRYLIYNARVPSLHSVRTNANDDCYICSRSGVFGLGDAQELFARKD